MKVVTGYGPALSGSAALVLAVLLSACGGGSGGGDGGTGKTVTLPTRPGLEMVTHIEPYDLDQDGRMDLIMVLAPDEYGAGARIAALMNTESGFEYDEQYLPADLFPSETRWMESITMVDINGDDHKDIVPHMDIGGMPVVLVWNDGSKKFEALDGQQFIGHDGTGFVPVANSDGDVDLLVHDEWNGGSGWYLIKNDGAGNFSRDPADDPIFDSYSDADFINHPVVLDVNGDNRDDLVFGGPKYDNGWVDQKVPLTVMLNQSGGWVKAENAVIFSGDDPSFTHLRLTRTADFNGDGIMDIAIANHGFDVAPHRGEYNGVLLSKPGFGFEVDTSSPAFNYRGFTHAMAVGDIDNDSDIDIVYVDITGDDVRAPIRVLYGDGNGNFTATPFKPKRRSGWISAALADLDGDGYLDLVVGSIGEGVDSYVFFNDGYGNFR